MHKVHTAASWVMIFGVSRPWGIAGPHDCNSQKRLKNDCSSEIKRNWWYLLLVQDILDQTIPAVKEL